MHYPRMFVAENDPAIVAQWVDIERDGSAMRAYYSAPRSAKDGTPCMVMAMHLYGVDSEQRDVARRLAKAGFATIVPDLYARFDAPSGDGATDPQPFMPFAQKLGAATVDPDIRAGARWLRERFPASKAAILGFCMGGIIALHRTSGYSDLFAAAAIWYGAILPSIDPALVDIPIVASYGADDRHIPAESVEAFRAGLRVPNDIAIYPNAGHAFFDHTRSSYEPKAAEDSWRRTTDFLERYLGT